MLGFQHVFWGDRIQPMTSWEMGLRSDSETPPIHHPTTAPPPPAPANPDSSRKVGVGKKGRGTSVSLHGWSLSWSLLLWLLSQLTEMGC